MNALTKYKWLVMVAPLLLELLMTKSLFITAQKGGVFNTPADEIFWFQWQLNRDEFAITGQEVRSNPMKYLGNIKKIQSMANKIITTVTTTKKPYGVLDARLCKELITLRSYLSNAAIKVNERIRDINLVMDEGETTLRDAVEKLKRSHDTFLNLSQQMGEIAQMVEKRSTQADKDLQENSIRQVLLDRVFREIDESKETLLKK